MQTVTLLFSTHPLYELPWFTIIYCGSMRKLIIVIAYHLCSVSNTNDWLTLD